DDRMRPLRQQLAAPLTALLNETKDPAQRAAALPALAATRADAATFALLAREITAPPAGADATTKTAAIAALLTLPASARASEDPAPAGGRGGTNENGCNRAFVNAAAIRARVERPRAARACPDRNCARDPH